MYVFIDEKGMVLTPNVDPEQFPELYEAKRIIEAPDDTIYGDTWDGEEWHKTGNREPWEPPEPEPDPLEELRNIINELLGVSSDE